jgi:ribosomal-protein-alanine N-acetyltransferase
MAMAARTRLSCLVRLVEASDIPGIYAVERACFPDPYPSIFLDDLMKTYQAQFFVAVDNSEIIGYAVASIGGKYGHIISLAVSPHHRRKRVGTALMSALEAKLTQEGAEEVHLEVRKGNGGAISFYERWGYRPVSEIRRYYPDGEDALVFERLIEAPAYHDH